jgi:DNA polymerase III subunit beta
MDTPPAPDVIVPGPTVTRLLSLLRGVDGPLSVTVSPTQIVVSAQSWALTSKLIDGTFPDYRRVLPERSPSPLLVRREALRNAAALIAAVHRGDKMHGLRLEAAGSELLVASLGDEADGACEVTIPIEGGPPAVAWMTGLNYRYLLHALDAIDTELVELHVARDPWSPVWLCAPGEAHDGSVIVPMRV